MTRPDDGVVPAGSRTTQTATHGSVGVAELTHAEVRDRLSGHIEGTLVDADRRGVDAHLAGCRDCVAFRATLKATIEATDRLPRPTSPRGARARILDQIRRQKLAGNGT